jgi:hypothetical protein
MTETKNPLNSRMILEIFGFNSQIYNEGIQFLQKKSTNIKNFDKNYQDWKETFYKIYGKEISLELFLDQSYFAHILKLLVISKHLSIKNLDLEDVYVEYKLINGLDLNIFDNDCFFWVNFDKKFVKKIYDKIKNTKYAIEDLFSDLYQQIFISDLRHKIGEFFTPSILVRQMIDDIYEFGSKILDPSCGSGNFLVDIIIKIISSSKSEGLKQKAIQNVYGFDINPLAIITTKTNIYLLLLEYFNNDTSILPDLNIFLVDSLFPESSKKKNQKKITETYNSFDIVIGNPPWLTYKDLHDKNYQIKIRELSSNLNIKPPSQYITHIELAAVFFYAIPLKFLKSNGMIFFVMPKSVINGDHCYRFRSFSLFNDDLEIWDFPKNYFFNVPHICLKAEYIGKINKSSIIDKYPIRAKIFNNKLELKEETIYTSLEIDDNGAKLILAKDDMGVLNKLKKSPYRKLFFQGATLVPRTLVFFIINEKTESTLTISSDPDVESRAKKNWEYNFKEVEIEQQFRFKTFLNRDLIPFFLKHKKNIFLPVNDQFEHDLDFLQNHPLALNFYEKLNKFYQAHKKETSEINTLFANLNYWNKLSKQIDNKAYIVVYNASGSNLKAAVINNKNHKLIIASENYYYSTDSLKEAHYLAAILNSPNLSRNIKLIKSSRHIHKRPFVFPIPIYDETNEIHYKLAKKGIKCETLAQDLFFKNPKIKSEKVRTIINQKLLKIQELTDQIIFY